MKTSYMRKRIERRLFPPRSSKRSQQKQRQPKKQQKEETVRQNDGSITELDIINIYTDIGKLCAIEHYLNMLYRPFTCFVRTQCEYRLDELKCCLKQTCYEPTKHSALIVRHTNPSCRLKVYENGSISSQGYSYESAAQGIRCFIGTMKELGYTPLFHNPHFNVINATFAMPFYINLKQLYRDYRENCLYNAQTHPYLIFNVPEWSIKLAIFAMGYVFVLLAPQPSVTQKAIAFILPILYGHRMMAARIPSGEESWLQSGDITFKLLWENEFQKAYQDTLKCAR